MFVNFCIFNKYFDSHQMLINIETVRRRVRVWV